MSMEMFGGHRAVAICMVDAIQTKRVVKGITLSELCQLSSSGPKTSVTAIYDFVSSGVSDLTSQQFHDICLSLDIAFDKILPNLKDLDAKQHFMAVDNAITEALEVANKAYAKMMAEQQTEESPIDKDKS